MAPPVFAASYSAWKVFAATAVMLNCAVWPLTPGFGDDLVYTSFFFTAVGYPILVVACAIIAGFALALLPVLVRAILRKPALEISADGLRLWRFRWLEYPLSCLTAAPRKQSGNLHFQCSDGRKLVIPVWIYQDPAAVQRQLLDFKTDIIGSRPNVR